MTFQLSRRDVDSAYAYANRNMRRLHRDPEEHGKGVLDKFLKTGTVLAGAAAVGVASGRFGPLNIANTPIPLDLVGGIGGHLVAFWLDSPKASKHIHNFSDGILAGYITKVGVGVGTTLRQKAGLPPMMTSGADPSHSPQLPEAPFMQYDVVGAASHAAPLTEAELAALAQQVR